MQKAWLGILLAVALMLPAFVAMADSGDVTTVTWFAARPLGGEIDLTMRQIAEEYSKLKGGKWVLNVETTADRPSYLQKLKTMIAGNKMPDIIDIDADP